MNSQYIKGNHDSIRAYLCYGSINQTLNSTVSKVNLYETLRYARIVDSMCSQLPVYVLLASLTAAQIS